MAEWREIDPGYDDPESYGRAESYRGEGKYPPDWERRRRVIWHRQSDACGRCGRARDDVHSANVHHIRPLDEGGSNALDNLVGLCGDCHALIHPLNEAIDGFYRCAPIFPVTDAVAEVATVRSKEIEELSAAVQTDLERVEEFSVPDVNEVTVNSFMYDIGSAYAKRLPDELTAVLQENGVIAKSSDYYVVEITVKLQSLRAILSTYTPEINIRSDGSLVAWSNWDGRWRTLSRVARLSEDTTHATLVLTDGTGTTERFLSLDRQSTTESFTAKSPSLWS